MIAMIPNQITNQGAKASGDGFGIIGSPKTGD